MSLCFVMLVIQYK